LAGVVWCSVVWCDVVVSCSVDVVLRWDCNDQSPFYRLDGKKNEWNMKPHNKCLYLENSLIAGYTPTPNCRRKKRRYLRL